MRDQVQSIKLNQMVDVGTSPRRRVQDIHFGDRLFYFVLKAAAWSVVLLFLTLVIMLFKMSFPILQHQGFRFFVEDNWDPAAQIYGAKALVFGTLVTSLIALIIAVPVSLGVALYLNEMAPRKLARVIAFIVEMLAAIPSLVYGFWGLFVLAPFLRESVQPFLKENLGWTGLMGGPPLGVGYLCAGIILAIMIIPTIASLSREVFRSIPDSHREAARGLGATDWETIQIAVIQTARPGVLAAIMLGLGRALGETMAVTMVIGNRIDIGTSLFSPGQTMASVLANQFAEADNDLHLSALTAVALTLFIVSLLINSFSRLIIWKLNKNFKRVRK